ncbi:MAG: hypothetical protein ACK6C4_02720, partial [Bacteroidota bacterium]
AQRIILSSLDPVSNGTLFLERRLTEVIVGIMLLRQTLGSRVGSGFVLRAATLTVVSAGMSIALVDLSVDVEALSAWEALITLARMTAVVAGVMLCAAAVGLFTRQDVQRLRKGLAGGAR